MILFIVRRLGQAAITILSVMVLTFLLFRVVAGDIASAHLGEKATESHKADWRRRHGYEKPLWLNVHNRLQLVDLTTGDEALLINDAGEHTAVDRLTLLPAENDELRSHVRYGHRVLGLDAETPLRLLATGLSEKESLPPVQMAISTSSGEQFTVDATAARTAGELIRRINDDPNNINSATGEPLVHAEIDEWDLRNIFNSQFFDHLLRAATFQGRSLVHDKKLTEIIADRAPKSLALMIPATALGWLLAMIVACFVAYYRGTAIDHVGVLLSVLGMCIPFLAYMIYGQWIMWRLAPNHAYGLHTRANIYVPIAIMVVAGLGGSVRFYRTVILDEVNRDYVRTAQAKGVALPGILFKHVLKNSMLPILTRLIMAIPFLIMGSLLVERYFGINGLGDLMISSINGRDEPVVTGLVFLSAVFYTVGVLITDLSYALFDPRIRLR